MRKKRSKNKTEGRNNAMDSETKKPLEDELDANAAGNGTPPDSGDAAEQPEVVETADAVAQELKKLTDELEKTKGEREEYLTLAQRVQADFDNYRRRNQNARAESFEDGAREFAKLLLPAMDNLERAIALGSEDEKFLSGVKMTLKQMQDAFEKRGIKEIECLGQKFDPAIENAVLQAPAEEGESGTVCEVFQKGYKMGDIVLRHAMVKVIA
ncbi:MAG: nucleotide exchange factor GrpE [Eubacteriales bacterium]|nr:nucleotide exchange factor GrpE [Eubacteriales bacterium]MDD3881133.1 nucleotide exchange factor GrpE [Eubacteriales bacterium]MDD4511515.1 nucleotide exchange factor GrpE [Eubacteriales bacterium]